MSRKWLYKQLIAKYGNSNQLTVLVEELSELTKEICKYQRGNGNIGHIAEEIADVEIMLEQAKLIFHIGEDNLEEIKDYKINRTFNRLF